MESIVFGELLDLELLVFVSLLNFVQTLLIQLKIIGILSGIINEYSTKLDYLLPGLIMFIVIEFLDVMCIYMFYYKAKSVEQNVEIVNHRTEDTNTELEIVDRPANSASNNRIRQVISLTNQLNLIALLLYLVQTTHIYSTNISSDDIGSKPSWIYLRPLSISNTIHSHRVHVWNFDSIPLVIFFLVSSGNSWQKSYSDGLVHIHQQFHWRDSHIFDSSQNN